MRTPTLQNGHNTPIMYKMTPEMMFSNDEPHIILKRRNLRAFEFNNHFSALLKLVNKVVPYDMMHNSETDAADLLMEIERLDLLVEAVDTKSYKKVSLYLKSCVPYAPDPENTTLMKTALEIYLKFDKYCEAMFVALQLNEDELIEDIFLKCTDLSTRKQLSYILGRQQAHRVLLLTKKNDF